MILGVRNIRVGILNTIGKYHQGPAVSTGTVQHITAENDSPADTCEAVGSKVGVGKGVGGSRFTRIVCQRHI